MGRPDYIFGQSRETARCRDAQHGDGVCCAFAPQIVLLVKLISATVFRRIKFCVCEVENGNYFAVWQVNDSIAHPWGPKY